MACSGIGTKVYSLDDGDIIIVPPDKADKYIPLKGTKEVQGIKKISIHIVPDDVIQADVIMICTPDIITASPIYYMVNPETLKQERITKIEFESGDNWKAPELPVKT